MIGIDTEPSREDRAALAIQCFVRQLLAKRARQRREKEKKVYEELMDRLEKEVRATPCMQTDTSQAMKKALGTQYYKTFKSL